MPSGCIVQSIVAGQKDIEHSVKGPAPNDPSAIFNLPVN